MSELNEVAKLHTPACLIIMDGFGIAEKTETNAITAANTPFLDELMTTCPKTLLHASGESVGLPKGQMGNSEVGHLNIGAGRVVFQELSRINNACENGLLVQNSEIIAAFDEAKKPGAALHFMGLLSDGGVHSSNQHLYALLRLAVELEVPQIFVHCFMDGRDVAPQSGATFIAELEKLIEELNNEVTRIAISSIAGRYYAMDRDNRWERVEKAYQALVNAEPCTSRSAEEVITDSYNQGITDEFIVPIALNERGICGGDSLFFFNFRPDRAREITRAIVDLDFTGFIRKRRPSVYFLCLTEYDPTIDASIAFKKEFPENVLADVLADAGLKQYHIAETEKYAHVTFFLNGGIEEPRKHEIRKLIPSPHVATYDLKPEMSAPEVADTLAKAINNKEADVYIVNFANCDMVGHTGSLEATKVAVEAVDKGVKKVLEALKSKQGIALLTADHGNADKMMDEQGNSFTAHTTALVPLVLIDYAERGLSLSEEIGSLSNISPTLLECIGLCVPKEMSAKSLLAKDLPR